MRDLNETEKAKVQRFMMDAVLSSAVYDVLLQSFLKKRGDESTEMKAARFIATELLEEGWKNLDRYKLEIEENGPVKRQNGL